jgi:membrane-bound ClpP family serine protease
MTLIAALVLATLVLVFFEVILPGGILGVFAALCLLAATWAGFGEFGFVGGSLTFLFTVVAAAILVFVEFKFLAKSPMGNRFFLRSSVTGHSNEAQGEPDIVGREAVALTRLNPSGRVAVDGRTYDAYSDDGYIEKDATVLVARKDSFKLIIKKP